MKITILPLLILYDVIMICLVPVLAVETVLGMMTNLPCNITPSVPGDQVLIVLW